MGPGCRIPSPRRKLGEGGIRTLGTLLGYGALAKRCFQPLSHLTKKSEPDCTSAHNMAENCRLPTPLVRPTQWNPVREAVSFPIQKKRDANSVSYRNDF